VIRDRFLPYPVPARASARLPAGRIGFRESHAMRSGKSSRLLDLSRDLPTSAADVIALRQARQNDRLSLEDYLDFLARFPAPTFEELRARRAPAGDWPFEL